MPPTDPQIVFRSACVTIGQFRAQPTSPLFRCSGPPGDHLFVFPRQGVWIEHEGQRPFVADPNVVTFYNPDQEYYRSSVSGRGDRSDWFALHPELLEALLAALSLPVDTNGKSLFPFLNGPGDPASYLAQRRLIHRIRRGTTFDALEIDERVIALAARVIGNAARRRGSTTDADSPAQHRALVEEARELLAGRFQDQLSIAEIAAELASSPFHLSRVFRRLTGLSLHQYRMRLRLAAGLLQITDRPLIDLAFDLGFSSHSHFSAAFGRLYGSPPREVRQSLDAAESG